MMRRLVLGLAIGVSVAAGGAVAQRGGGSAGPDDSAAYRSGLPAVLAPKPESPAVATGMLVPSALVRERFRRGYRRIGSPRIALFWNREFGDRLREFEVDSRLTVRVDASEETDEAGAAAGKREKGELTAAVERRTDSRLRSPSAPGAGGLMFQAGFLQPLIEEGARIVDRAVIMRLTDAARRLDDSAAPLDDRQLVETVALKDHVDMLIQVAQRPSVEAGPGTSFHVSVIEVGTGRVRASFVHDTEVKRPPPKKVWRAVKGGYVEVDDDSGSGPAKIDSERVGRALAERTMTVLASLPTEG